MRVCGGWPGRFPPKSLVAVGLLIAAQKVSLPPNGKAYEVGLPLVALVTFAVASIDAGANAPRHRRRISAMT